MKRKRKETRLNRFDGVDDYDERDTNDAVVVVVVVVVVVADEDDVVVVVGIDYAAMVVANQKAVMTDR